MASVEVVRMSTTDRLAEVLSRSKKNFGPDIGQMIDSLLTPVSLSIMAGILAVWAGSHFFGVGEIVDVLLLVVGAFTIGWSITDVAKDLYEFARLTIYGTTDADLEKAAKACGSTAESRVKTRGRRSRSRATVEQTGDHQRPGAPGWERLDVPLR